MEIATLIPSPEAIPVTSEWFGFLLTLTFMLHLLFMNVMVGTGIISLCGHLRQNAGTCYLEKDISQKLTFIIAFTINLGVAPFLFLQVLYGQFIYVSSMIMAVYWLSVIILLIIAYYSAYYYKFNFDRLHSARTYFISFTVLIFFVIAFLFTNNMTLMSKPETWTVFFDNPRGTVLNLSDPSLFPRFLHFMTASAAVGGLFIALLWSLKQKKGIPGAEVYIERGMKWFTYSTALQILIGSWFLISLPKEIMLLFMGRNTIYTHTFIISLILTVMTLVFGFYRKVRGAAISALALVFSMILMRDMLRTAYLAPYFRLTDIPVIPQYSPMIIFFASFIGTAVVVIYVLRLGAGVKHENDSY